MHRLVRRSVVLVGLAVGGVAPLSPAVGQGATSPTTPKGVEKPVPGSGPAAGEGRSIGGPAESKPVPKDLVPRPIPKPDPPADGAPAPTRGGSGGTQTGSANPSGSQVVGQTPGYRPRPWHLAITPVVLGKSLPADEVSADLQLLDDPPLGKPYFLAPLSGELNGIGFYFGVCCDGFAATTGGGLKLVRSPGYIFTRWDTRNPKYVRPARGEYILASDHEGDIVSARARCQPARGVYTFTLRVVGRWADTAGPYVLVGGYVHCHGTKATQYVGAIRFDGREVVLGRELGPFVEMCADWDDPGDQSDKLTGLRVAYGNWRAGSGDARPVSILADYDERVPQKARAFLSSACPDIHAKGLDATLRRGRSVVVVVRGEDWPRNGLRRDHEPALNSFGQPVGWRRWEWLFRPSDRAEATYPSSTDKK